MLRLLQVVEGRRNEWLRNLFQDRLRVLDLLFRRRRDCCCREGSRRRRLSSHCHSQAGCQVRVRFRNKYGGTGLRRASMRWQPSWFATQERLLSLVCVSFEGERESARPLAPVTRRLTLIREGKRLQRICHCCAADQLRSLVADLRGRENIKGRGQVSDRHTNPRMGGRPCSDRNPVSGEH